MYMGALSTRRESSSDKRKRLRKEARGVKTFNYGGTKNWVLVGGKKVRKRKYVRDYVRTGMGDVAFDPGLPDYGAPIDEDEEVRAGPIGTSRPNLLTSEEFNRLQSPHHPKKFLWELGPQVEPKVRRKQRPQFTPPAAEQLQTSAPSMVMASVGSPQLPEGTKKLLTFGVIGLAAVWALRELTR
jgi:hypothetical protein